MDLVTTLVLVGLAYLILAPLVALVISVYNWARMARLESDTFYLKSNLCDCKCMPLIPRINETLRDVPYTPSGSIGDMPDPEHDVPIRVEDSHTPSTTAGSTAESDEITPSAKTPLSTNLHP